MYAKCGCVDKARKVFDGMESRVVISWNSMLACYSRNGRAYEALLLCSKMASEGMTPSEGTVTITLSACADIAALRQGRQTHGLIWRFGFHSNDKVKVDLVDLYAKCGLVRVANKLFDLLEDKRVMSWNAMITGYAMHGYAAEALSLFDTHRRKLAPDGITFLGVLSACSQGGLLDDGWRFFEMMQRDYGIEPTVQHYTCMVDMLGHCGRLTKAYDLVMQMRLLPDSGIWGTLLNPCKIHGHVEIAELALERIIKLEADDAGNYVILSNMYAQAGKVKQSCKSVANDDESEDQEEYYV